MLALIVGIAVLVAGLVILLVIMSVKSPSGAARPRARRRPQGVALKAAAAVGVTGLVILAASLMPLVPAASEHCGGCHAVAPAVEAWRADAHAEVSCYGCHARAGVFGAVEASLGGALSLLSDSAAQPLVATQRCLRCHESISRGSLVAGGIRVRHAELIQGGADCGWCHEAIGHAGRGAPDPTAADTAPIRRSVMTRCLRCHDGSTASAECVTCHVDGSPSDAAEARQAAGRSEIAMTCNGCHTKATAARCIECHGLEMPHGADFMRRHAGLSANEPDMCAKCHEQAAAAQPCGCHEEANEHGTYSEWFPRHGQFALKDGQGGCRCHDAAFCQNCHDDSPF